MEAKFYLRWSFGSLNGVFLGVDFFFGDDLFSFLFLGTHVDGELRGTTA